ncbi:MAG: right-handed parallel beta-helix repeat-containing protein [Planctomycetota bacterium]|nr:right-handed parallel beta-helix repeat-containing protein [Planctomycetota bacterium]
MRSTRISARLWATATVGVALFWALSAANGAEPQKEPAMATTDQVRSPGNTAYHVDAKSGDDANPGTAPDKAWKSIARVNGTAFAPGDKVLFAGGQTFKGALSFGKASSGTKDKPIIVSSFGQGRATIDGGSGSGFALTDCAFVTIKELNFVGCGRKNGSDGTGIQLTRTKNIEVDSIDASGFRNAGVATGGDENTRITRVYAHDNGFAGITTCGGYGDVPRTKNLYIGRCVAENNPGDPKNLNNHSGNGIVVGGLDGALVEYCEAMNNGWDMPRKGNGPVGIWGWQCDRLTIQFCIAHDNKTQKGAYDGGGFDFDGGMTNSILQYNLSYNNHGAGYLLCQYPGASRWQHNICRYNVSVNDGLTNHDSGLHFWAGGPEISDALVYNNVIVNGKHAVKSTHDIAGLVFRNNIFISDGESISGPLHKARFENNLYWPRQSRAVFGGKTLEEWAKATGQELVDGKLAGLFADPKLVMPEKDQKLPTDPQKLAAMAFYRLREGSPCLGAGAAIKDNGGRDLFGNPVPDAKRPSMGAHEPAAPR